MCVVAFACNAHPRWRLLLAGNRDEFHARPTAAAARWPDSGLLAGRDLQSGGTWVGLDTRGRVAVVPNVRDGFAKPHDGPSRGALPHAFLAGSADAAGTTDALLAGAHAYAPFNLMLADAGGCWHLGNHPRQRDVLAAGVHGISNGRHVHPWRNLRNAGQHRDRRRPRRPRLHPRTPVRATRRVRGRKRAPQLRLRRRLASMRSMEGGGGGR